MKQISFNTNKNKIIDYDEDEVMDNFNISIEKNKNSIIKQKSNNLDFVDTKDINLYELEIIKKVPWLRTYSNTYIKIFDNKDHIYYNNKKYIIKDRDKFYLAKSQFFELLSNKNSEIVFNNFKNLLTVSKICSDGKILISSFSICYHINGKYDENNKFKKEDIYIFQNQIYENEIIWRRMNNITKKDYLSNIFDDYYEIKNLENYEIKSLYNVSKNFY